MSTGRAPFRTGVIISLVAVATLLAGCSDKTEVITFTDEHGRVCTALATNDGGDGDRQPTAIDCEYPPPGRSPGPTTVEQLPGD